MPKDYGLFTEIQFWLSVLHECLLNLAEFDRLEWISALVLCHVPPRAGEFVYKEHKPFKYTKA